MAYFSCLNRGLKPNLSSGRIDGTIKVRSNVDPTFFSLVGSRRSRGTTTTPLFSRIHTSLIKRARTVAITSLTEIEVVSVNRRGGGGGRGGSGGGGRGVFGRGGGGTAAGTTC
ncbi:uncharacterized protein LOC114380331 [Glycine soja]|uniref:uncharacterized protein LOC114380331 n=1 Tax=Glycine soja TaxID=3848 RepID=UPI0010403C62|nr:uncharacterized protein LOC114380331 [Glycine soja]